MLSLTAAADEVFVGNDIDVDQYHLPYVNQREVCACVLRVVTRFHQYGILIWCFNLYYSQRIISFVWVNESHLRMFSVTYEAEAQLSIEIVIHNSTTRWQGVWYRGPSYDGTWLIHISLVWVSTWVGQWVTPWFPVRYLLRPKKCLSIGHSIQHSTATL